MSSGVVSTCPCQGLLCTGFKLTKYGHLTGCVCHPCRGRRNQRKGKRGQAQAHRALGGVGFTPSQEESGRSYTLEVQVEVKAGAQVPAKFRSFLASDWFRRALSQAERAVPVGVAAAPAVMLLPEGGGRWLVVKVK